MEVEEFLTVPEEGVVYGVTDNNQIITDAEIFKEENSNNVEDSTEVAIISASAASKALETVQTFLIQQENANEYLRYADILEKYIGEKKANSIRQSSVDQYLNKL